MINNSTVQVATCVMGAAHTHRSIIASGGTESSEPSHTKSNRRLVVAFPISQAERCHTTGFLASIPMGPGLDHCVRIGNHHPGTHLVSSSSASSCHCRPQGDEEEEVYQYGTILGTIPVPYYLYHTCSAITSTPTPYTTI
eukprot:scaffold9369_cov182-Amphora_coffeaeformis.AAC.9